MKKSICHTNLSPEFGRISELKIAFEDAEEIQQRPCRDGWREPQRIKKKSMHPLTKGSSEVS
jgi:hypothetical protein